MVSLAVVIPSLAKQLAAPALLIAFLPSIQMIGITVPQLFSAFYTERLVRMKLQGLIFGLLQRIPWVLMALLMPLWAVQRPALMMTAFVLLFAFSYLCIGASKPAWGELIAKSIPTRMRGRFMGQLNFWGALAGLAGSFFVHRALADTSQPWQNRYAMLFGVCSVLLFISYALFTGNKEPLLPPPPATHRSMGEYLGALPALLRNDRGFSRFVIASMLASTNTVGQAFLLIYVLKDRALADSVAGSFAISSALGSVCASLLLGWIGDRFGYKRVMMLSFLLYCLSMALVMATHSVASAHVAFFGLMFNWVGTNMVSTNMVFEFAPPGKRPTYLGVANTLVAPVLLLSSLAGGLLAPLKHGYEWSLGLSALCAVGGLAVMAGLKDPRKVNQGEGV
jgi:MFS family permease